MEADVLLRRIIAGNGFFVVDGLSKTGAHLLDGIEQDSGTSGPLR